MQPRDNIYAPEYVKDLFDRMSRSYERMNYVTSFGFSLRWRKQFVKAIDCSVKEPKIIDLLTGMGETWTHINKRWPNAKLTALDFSDGMLRYAEKKNKIKFEGKINVIKENLLENDLPADHYDIVTCAFGLKTFNEEQIKILALETKRILRTGGQCTFIEVSKPNGEFLKFMYGIYLGKFIPVLGKLFLGDPEEYRMLWRYTSSFSDCRSVAEIFRSTGLHVEYKSYFFGCASGFVARKEII